MPWRTRRRALLGGLALAVTACANGRGEGVRLRSRENTARLHARARAAPVEALRPGEHTVVVPGSRDTLLYIPESVSRGALVVSMHGAGGNAGHGLEMLRREADEHGFAVLAPASEGRSWDVITGGYGPDVRGLDVALTYAFERVNVSPSLVAVSGFSDGASYALSIGVANGDLFPHIIAFSPGFMAPPSERGKPRVFVSHGLEDRVLPIQRCSRVLVPALRRANYEVEYQEFDGPHTVPGKIKAAGIHWWLNRTPSEL